MFPWIWIFAPQTFWPLSGAVDLSLDAFFRGIQPGAGVPEIEKRVFEQASYGKQLGWLTDVVVDALGPKKLKSAEAKGSLASLEKLHTKIETIKSGYRQARADARTDARADARTDVRADARTDAAIALLDQMQSDSPEELKRLLARYQSGRALSRTPPART
jgi:hypothetical protein